MVHDRYSSKIAGYVLAVTVSRNGEDFLYGPTFRSPGYMDDKVNHFANQRLDVGWRVFIAGDERLQAD
jgi:hypothetical protein